MRKKKNIQNYPIHLLNAKQCLSSFISHMELKKKQPNKPSEIKIFQNRLRSSYNIISFILSFSSSDFRFAIKKNTHTKCICRKFEMYYMHRLAFAAAVVVYSNIFSMIRVCVCVCVLSYCSVSV